MSVFSVGSKFIFGLVDQKPTLPDGFSFIEAKDQFLMASDNSGKRWFVLKDRLHPEGRFENGERFCDTRETIML